MAGYIDTVLPATDEPTVFQEVMADHLANGVPTSSWRSLVNVGLSITHYAAEAFSTSWNLARRVFRGMFVDSIQEDIAAATDAAAVAEITAAAAAFARSQYQEDLQPATFATLRVRLLSASTAPPYSPSSGTVIAGTPNATAPLLYTLSENAIIQAGSRSVRYFTANSPGAAYNLGADASFELKTTLVGVSASLPASGERYVFGTGNSAVVVHAGFNSGTQVGLGFRVTGASYPTTDLSVLGSNIWVNMRSDAGSAPLATSEECRLVLTANVPATQLQGVQLEEGSTGAGIVAVTSMTPLPQATTPLQDAGQNAEGAAQLMDRCVGKWDALDVGNGTEDALLYWLLKAPEGYTATPVAQAQVLNLTKPDGTISGGYVTCLVSGPLGPLSGPDLAAVQANMLNPRKNAAFTILTVVNASSLVVTVTATVVYSLASKISAADLASAIAANLLVLQGLLRMGAGTLSPSVVEGYIVGASPAIVRGSVTMSLPAAPVSIAWNERVEFVMSGFVYTGI